MAAVMTAIEIRNHMTQFTRILVGFLFLCCACNGFAQNSWAEYQQTVKEANAYIKTAKKGSILHCTANDPISVTKTLNGIYRCERSAYTASPLNILLNDALSNGWEIVTQSKIPVELISGDMSYKMTFILKKK